MMVMLFLKIQLVAARVAIVRPRRLRRWRKSWLKMESSQIRWR